ncbi:glycosyltransferase [Ruminococcus sp.]|uniref:glycosyltransferase n=1 Tax=Ruminococcus sp. TaxID=41978 RepID=UPI0025EAA087|nr:glycosyltransferase [Ruminococcus sp.]
MSGNIKVSVIVPAHNEEKYVERCIKSVKQAAARVKCGTEVIVVCNRCTDRTAELALAGGARVVYDESRCIASVRNAGIAAAKGKVIMTIDCDNRMTEDTIREVLGMLNSGRYIGGGAPLRFERYSPALRLNDLMCRAGFGLTGLYCGIFWAEKRSFDAIGGFVEKKAGEDIATAKALRAYGKKQGKRYGCLRRNHLINSTRKYDDMGDWLYFRLAFRNADALIRAAFGDSSEYDKLMDEMFYDYNDNRVKSS